MVTLGGELARLRRLKGWSLRDVEEKTKKRISNSYLYQLENGNVKEPSPNVLLTLANIYGASYPDLMRLAGFVVPTQGKPRAQNSVAFNALELTPDEEEEVLDFVEFLRSKKEKRQS